MDRSWKSKVFQTIFAHPDNIRFKSQTPIVKEYLKDISQNNWAIDIGCGTGRSTKFLVPLAQSVVCIDPNPDMLRRVQQKLKVVGAYCSAIAESRKGVDNRLLLVQGKVERLPFKSGIFEIALLLEVLEHIEDDKNGLYEVCRILKQDAKLIISTPCPPPAYPDTHHKRDGYTKKDMITLLESIGFKIIAYKFCMFLWTRMILKFAVNFIILFKFPPPVLFLLKLEQVFKKPPPFDIIVKARKL
ncbi:MAG: class I SAM-dependent methyltransferase [Candidatus Stahlbacteria bacterium]|nr:class I SAM-dependent methyltransferase [Candidatus Stahlbacteria bacterium]